MLIYKKFVFSNILQSTEFEKQAADYLIYQAKYISYFSIAMTKTTHRKYLEEKIHT